MKKRILFCVIVSIAVLGISCQKGPGIGGEATIKGRVTGILFDKTFRTKLDSGAVGNWTVNILYGSDLGVDASQKTDYNGFFEFQYLRDGHYTVFLYSRAHKSNLPDSSITIGLDITSTKQVFTVPDIKIFH